MINRSCLIVEDDEVAINLLKSYLKNLPFFEVVATCSSYSEALEILSTQKIDLIFLDIELQENSAVSGINILQAFQDLPPVIITTNYPEYAVTSYEIGKAADYLLKPFSFNRFLLGVNRALGLRVISERIVGNDFLFLKLGRKFQRFDLNEIDYFEAWGNYLKVITADITHVANESLSGVLELLDSKRFIRVHKSYIININKINSFDHNNFFLRNKKIPIGTSYKPQAENFLKLFDKIED